MMPGHEPVIEQLAQRLGADPSMRDLVPALEAIPVAVERIWAKDYQPWFTDHGPSHSRRVSEYAHALIDLPNLIQRLRLTPLEEFILWAAAWLHDIGMQDLLNVGYLGDLGPEGYAQVRHKHPDQSARRIANSYMDLGLPPDDYPLAEVVSEVARAHGTAYYEETVRDRLEFKTTVRNRPVRPRLLAAVLLFADELDLHHERTAALSGPALLNQISEAHAFKHKVVRSVAAVCGNDGSIAVAIDYNFPEALEDGDAAAVQRWIRVKLQKQMAMVGPELSAGFEGNARFDPNIRTTARIARARMDLPSPAALAFIRAEAAGPADFEYDATSRWASDHAKALMIEAGRLHLLAVDDAVELVYDQTGLGNLILELERKAGQTYEPLGRPTREQLVDVLDQAPFHKDVLRELHGALPAQKVPEENDWKLRLDRILYARLDHVQPLTLRLVPQPWFVERAFNRTMLNPPTPSDAAEHITLVEVGRRHALGLLRHPNRPLVFPSGFYVELAVLAEGGEVVIVNKDERMGGADEAAAGRHWSCSVEEGARLDDCEADALLVHRVAYRGLQQELGIAEDKVRQLSFYALVLQTHHVNTAILGVAHTGTSIGDISRYVADRKEHRSAAGVQLSAAVAFLHSPDAQHLPGTWHQTARFRLLLALAEAGVIPWP